MSSRQKVRLTLFAVLGFFLVLALADVLGWRESETGVRSPRGYVAVSHGDHNHYVPNAGLGGRHIDEFPMEPPPPGMTVGPNGQFVPLE